MPLPIPQIGETQTEKFPITDPNHQALFIAAYLTRISGGWSPTVPTCGAKNHFLEGAYYNTYNEPVYLQCEFQYEKKVL